MKEYLLILFIFMASVAYGQKTTSTETYDVVISKGRLDQIEIEPRVFDPNQSK